MRRRQKANLNQILTALTKDGYVVAQEYLPEADHGEKRIVLLGGEPIRFGDDVSIYRRVPLLRGAGDTSGGRRGPRPQALRLRQGRGAAVRDPATQAADRRPVLRAVDLVGDKILDLNVFTPSGLHSLSEIYGVDVAEIVIRDLERRVRLRAAYRTTFDPEAADIV